ncbi:MAG: helix-turn-helix domain-containing protein [Abditibacteriales bacterium]|nr:helix-turn-helix domain-containing protein [Abditibacteriales bacterium]
MSAKKGRPQKVNRNVYVVAQWLRERVEKDLQLSQGDLAQLLGVERQTVNRWMNAENSPPYDVVVAIYRMARRARQGVRDLDALRAEAQKVRQQDVEAFTADLDTAFKNAAEKPKAREKRLRVLGSISKGAPSLTLNDRTVEQVADLIAHRVHAKLDEWNAPRKMVIRKLGVIAAGTPRMEEEQAETIPVDELLVSDPQTTYFLRVSGDSMSDAGILEGDLVIVDAAREAQNNDIVVAEVDGEWTIKQLRKQGDTVTLLPANAKYKPIQPKQELRLAGVVTAVVRTLKRA